MSARIFIGYPTCRNPDWLRLSVDYSVDTFLTAFTLRMFPPWTHAVVAQLIPARYRMKRHLATGRRIIKPLIEKHADIAVKGGQRDNMQDDSLLDWMLDNATEQEKALPEMSNRQCILTLASIHTTSMSVTNLLYDLCENPENFPLLREEIDEVYTELGQLGENPKVTSKLWLSKLEKLDSCFIESQRVNPVVLRT